MPKVIVILKNMENGAIQESETNSQGLYGSLFCAAIYMVTAEAPNFMTPADDPVC